MDLNQRPPPCQGGALPTELRDHKFKPKLYQVIINLTLKYILAYFNEKNIVKIWVCWWHSNLIFYFFGLPSGLLPTILAAKYPTIPETKEPHKIASLSVPW